MCHRGGGITTPLLLFYPNIPSALQGFSLFAFFKSLLALGAELMVIYC